MAAFVPASWQRIVLTLASLGRGLRRSADGATIEFMPSADAASIVTYGSDGGMAVTKAAVAAAALPAVTTADNGKSLSVVAGVWAAAVPAGLSLLKTEFFTSTSLVSNNAGWTKVATAKWVVVIVVGGGGSGCDFTSANQGFSGGEPGSVEVWSGWASDLPATADVVVGAGGAGKTGYNSKSGSADGTASTFAGLISANGGRGGANSSRAATGGARVQPLCSLVLGCPGTDTSNAPQKAAEDTMLGPGAGGGNNYNGGASSVARPKSKIAGGVCPSSGNPVAGGNAIANDPWSFGAGGAGGNGNNSIDGGAGGAPGGGGGCGFYSTGGDTVYGGYGAGGRGEVRVLTYG